METVDQEISSVRANIQILPKNNDKNISKYKAYIDQNLEVYSNYQSLVKEEINDRYCRYQFEDQSKKLEGIRNKRNEIDFLSLFNPYNVPYEKLKFSVYLYDIGHFYKNHLDAVNEAILMTIELFRTIGINDLNFFYHPYVKEYLNVLQTHREDIDFLHHTFDTIYWKYSDLMTAIELNLKSIYYENEMRILKYTENQCRTILKQFHSTPLELYQTYLNLKKEEQDILANDKHNHMSAFLNGTFQTKDFKEDAIHRRYQSIGIYENNKTVNLKALRQTLKEYLGYLNYQYLILDIKKRYQDKIQYKAEYDRALKAIKANEKKLKGYNKKVNHKGFFFQSKKDSQSILLVRINELILELKKQYDDFKNISFNYQLSNILSDDSTLFDALTLGYSNYGYFLHVIKNQKPEITLEEANSQRDKLREVLTSSCQTILMNIRILEEKDIPMIVSDRYKMLNVNLEMDALKTEQEIRALLETLDILIEKEELDNLNLDISGIEFYCQVTRQKILDS